MHGDLVRNLIYLSLAVLKMPSCGIMSDPEDHGGRLTGLISGRNFPKEEQKTESMKCRITVPRARHCTTAARAEIEDVESPSGFS